MDNLISKNQCVFLAQRHIQDGVLVVNEILDFANKFKKKCLIMKVDFQKYFDCVSWIYLNYVMTRMGFCIEWIHWKDALVFKNSLSVLVNELPNISELRGISDKETLFLISYLFLR